MSNLINPYYPNIFPEEQKIYQHLLHLVQVESPQEMIGRFRTLFIEGINYPESDTIAILDQITASPKAEQEFQFFLNRCCHILINRWHMQPQLHSAIPELIELFQYPPSRHKITSFREKAIRRLHLLIKKFIESEQYTILRRLTQIITQPDSQLYEQKQLITLMRRYPYLYEHCLLTENSTFEHQWTVKKIKLEVQKKFELDLSRYVTYQVRCHQVNQVDCAVDTNRIIQPVTNPTLLTEKNLNATIQQFIGKVEGDYSYQEYAQLFLNYSNQASSFGAFKDDLYEYLISGIDWDYGKRQFHQRLYKQLKNTLADANEYKLDDFLLVRTCSQLLNFLVVESQISPQHFTFIDLIANQGTLVTTALLLKIVLICQKIKPYLTKRFAILFNHYESATTNGIIWLVETLEQLNVAYSIHFGNTDLSYFKQIF
ncbi:hypothetical protein [Brunnivagina elsteri]|uniref:Uncharacterized protein n=1 Tax=Brunnivagina elsteri CCALA 953 TaxID=987040 RepID=A0A2A2TA46_9CYAN|nr:hypothetical protein [Calothrix elsteri]PAX46822.1 hypothetical protein CK510_29040 [Calothrix elsteri CCALA 953]